MLQASGGVDTTEEYHSESGTNVGILEQEALDDQSL